MSKETIEQVRTRKDESAALARKRTEAVRALRETESRPRRDAEALYQKRFELAQRWIELHVLGSPAYVTQVGRDGFFWVRASRFLPTFVAWDESARIALEVLS